MNAFNDITEAEIQTGVTDSDRVIATVMGHPGKGQSKDGWQIPLNALIPRGSDNLLITGKSAPSFIHYIASCALIGQAAGVSAAISCQTGTPLRETPVELIRAELASARQGYAYSTEGSKMQK